MIQTLDDREMFNDGIFEGSEAALVPHNAASQLVSSRPTDMEYTSERTLSSKRQIRKPRLPVAYSACFNISFNISNPDLETR